MPWLHRPTGWAALGVVLLLGIVDTLLGVRLPGLEALERAAYDQRVRLTAPTEYTGDITLLMVDDAALASVGRWPWPRETLAAMVRELHTRHAPRLVVFDMVFSEAAANPDADAAFAQALGAGDSVLGYVVRPSGGAGRLTATDFLFNQPGIEAAARATGFLNSAVDPDGRLRRVPMLATWSRQTLPALSLAAYGVLTGVGESGAPAPLRTGRLAGSELELAPGEPWPLDPSLHALVPFFARTGIFPQVSAADVLAGKIAPGSLSDRIVVVGADATGLRDSYPSPISAMQPGVEVHATLLDAMMSGRSLRDSPGTRLLAGAWLLLVGGTALALHCRRSRAASWVATLGLAAGLIGNLALFASPGWVLPMVPTVMVLGLFTLMFLRVAVPGSRPVAGTEMSPEEARAGGAGHRATAPKSGGASTVPAPRESHRPAALDPVDGPSRVEMMVALFDLERLVDTLPAAALAQVFEAQREFVEATLADDPSARVSSLDDGRIMVSWASAGSQNLAVAATRAAARLLAGVRTLNQTLTAQKLPPVRLVVMAQGEPAEAASIWFAQALRRAADYGVMNLFDAQIRAACPTEIWRELDLVRIRPAAVPVAFFEMVPNPEEGPGDWDVEIAELGAALDDYRQGNLREARARFEALKRHSREPALYALYLERIDAVYGHAPAGWDGVTDDGDPGD